jgi:tetratricopeptide (TPR) repeat protein
LLFCDLVTLPYPDEQDDIGRTVGGAVSEYRYRAFISYSWSDAKWGNWLHHRLETYRTPAALVGKDGALGKVPARLNPIFKDREEEAAGASIGDAVEKALLASEFLIVVCSPNSAQSRWVDREIAFFKAHRDPDKVLALIVDGEPGSADAECFPIALTHGVNSDLTIGDSLADAPLAADARITGDGKRRAILKLAAAMLGVGLGELVNRDERRRATRTRIVVSASLALATVMSGLAWVAVQARMEAEFQRNEADGLVEFMLTDLRDRLEPVGRLDALDVVGTRALDYYAKQKLGDLDKDSLGRRARALLLVGEVSNIRGDSDDALRAFRQAAATTQEQLARDPDNQQRVFDHAQSVFWVGYIAYNRGELKAAEAQYREYKRLADRLIALDPKNPKWQMEGSYAETNLGVMFNAQGRHAESESAFANGLRLIEAVATSGAFNADQQIELGLAVNWLGVAKNEIGKVAESLALHQREIAVYEEVLRRDLANAMARNRLSLAHQFVGQQQLQLGQLDEAIRSYEQGIELNAEMRRLEPANTEWQETEVSGRLDLSDILAYAGRKEDSRAMLDAASALLGRMMAKDPKNAAWSVFLHSRELRTRGRFALAAGDTARAEALAAEALRLDLEPEDRVAALRLAGDVDARLKRTDSARSHWATALKLLPEYGGADLDRFRLSKRLGLAEQADAISERLDRRGFRHPAYLAERSR